MFKVYENDYLIYDDGKVYSIKRKKFQSPRKHTNGYLRATIHGKDMYIHRLVARCFIENPNNYAEVNHIDGNKANNNVSNLEWCTRSQNNKHAVKTGLRDKEFFKTISNCDKATTARKRRRIYSEKEAHEVKEYIKAGLTDTEIVKKVGGTKGAVYGIRKGVSYKDII